MARIGHLTAQDCGAPLQHWEKLTRGQCNNDLAEVKAKPLTARQIKDAAMREDSIARAERKFDKAAHTTGKDLRKLSDHWDKRSSTNTKGFFDQKKAREMKRGAV